MARKASKGRAWATLGSQDSCEVLSWFETWKWAAIEVPIGFGPLAPKAGRHSRLLCFPTPLPAAAMAMAMAVDIAMARHQPAALHTFTEAVPSWMNHGEALRNFQRLPRQRVQLFSLACTYRPTLNTSTTSQDEAAVDTSREELAFSVGASVIPHPDKVEKGGEDAYFVSSYNGGVLGVADGVSGWAEENVDPAVFAKELMAHAAAAVASEEMDVDAQALLHKAHTATSSVGAATAIVAIMERGGILHVANVGDCGLRILRQGKIVFATRPQQHFFDCPYQFSSDASGQSAADAQVYKAELTEGDTIVMGSDGLFDNVYDQDIESTLSLFGGSDQESVERAAVALATLASKNARDETYDSPYCRDAIQQGKDLPWYKKVLFGQKMTGGKVDDITVLVAHVVDGQTIPVETTVEVRIKSVNGIDSGIDIQQPADNDKQFPEGLAGSLA